MDDKRKEKRASKDLILGDLFRSFWIREVDEEMGKANYD